MRIGTFAKARHAITISSAANIVGNLLGLAGYGVTPFIKILILELGFAIVVNVITAVAIHAGHNLRGCAVVIAKHRGTVLVARLGRD